MRYAQSLARSYSPARSLDHSLARSLAHSLAHSLARPVNAAVMGLMVFLTLAIPGMRPAIAALSVVPSSWTQQLSDEMWMATSPPDATGNQAALIIPFVRPYSGNFTTWTEQNVPALLEQMIGPTLQRGPLTPKFRIKDVGGYHYGPANTLGFWQTFQTESGRFGAWVWAYPTNKGAQILISLIRDDMPLNADALQTAMGAATLADYSRAVDRLEAAPDSEQPGESNCRTYQPYSYTRQECDMSGCRTVLVPMDSSVGCN